MSNENTPDKAYRLVDLDEILELDNHENLKVGEIAVTVITPEGTIHAVPSIRGLKSHSSLLRPMYDDLFGPEVTKPDSYCIEIRHVIYDSDTHVDYPFIPHIITPEEHEELCLVLEKLLANNHEMLSSITDFDPRILSARNPKLAKEFESEQILDYLRSDVPIDDYRLPFAHTGVLAPHRRTKATTLE